MHSGRLAVLAEVLRARDAVTAHANGSEYVRQQLGRAADRLEKAAAVLAGGARRWHVFAVQWVIATSVAALLGWLVGLAAPSPVAVLIAVAVGGIAGPVGSRGWIRWRTHRGRAMLAASMNTGPASGTSTSLRNIRISVSRARTAAENSHVGAAPFPSQQWWGFGRVTYEIRAAWRAVARAASADAGAELPARMYQFDVDHSAAAHAVDEEASRLEALLTEFDRRASDEDLTQAAAVVDAAHGILWNTATQLGISRTYPPLPRARLAPVVAIPVIIAATWTATALTGWPAAAVAAGSLLAALVIADTLDGIVTSRLTANEPLTRAVTAVRPKPAGLPEAVATVDVWRQELAASIKAVDDLTPAVVDGDDDWRPLATENITSARNRLTTAHDILTTWRI